MSLHIQILIFLLAASRRRFHSRRGRSHIQYMTVLFLSNIEGTVKYSTHPEPVVKIRPELDQKIPADLH
jgi:hypothetical protein